MHCIPGTAMHFEASNTNASFRRITGRFLGEREIHLSLRLSV